MPVSHSLTNVLDEVVKIVNFIQFWTHEYSSFKYSMLRLEACITETLLLYTAEPRLFQRNTLCSWVINGMFISWNSIFVYEIYLLKLGYLAGMFTQAYRKSLLVSIQLKCLFPVLKVELLRKIRILENVYPPQWTWQLTITWNLFFPWWVMISVIVIFWYYIIKCDNIWRSIYSGEPIFSTQMAKWFFKSIR